MSRFPLVSILIPCYNAATYLQDTIESVIHQTYPNVEPVIVDDGSTDNSVAIVEKYKGKRGLNIYKQEKQGACVARNRALKEAKGEYIQYLDADDLLSRDKIASQMKLAEKWGEEYVYSCRWDRFTHDPSEATFPFRILDKNYEDPLKWFIEAFENSEMVANSSWFASRKLIDLAGKWNEELTLSQDSEYFARVITRAKGIKFDSRGKVYYRSNIKNSISSKYNSKLGIESSFLSVLSIEKTLISKYGNNDSVKRILADKYQTFIYRSYPTNKKLLKRARMKVESLGGSELLPNYKGKTLLLSKIVGWRLASLVKFLFFK